LRIHTQHLLSHNRKQRQVPVQAMRTPRIAGQKESGGYHHYTLEQT
jgi:hypothetical protein